jgi:hypothetical protein
MEAPAVSLLLTAPRRLAFLTVIGLVPLLIWDFSPGLFPADAHDLLASLPLALIGVAALLDPVIRRAPRFEVLKSLGLAAAFLFWAANQLWPLHPRATLFNDLAVALFVVDVLIGMRAPAAAAG